MKKRIILWAAVGCYCALIFLGSSIPGDIYTGPPGFDKTLHVIEYLFLSILLYHALIATAPSLQLRSIIVLTVSISFLYGVSDEIHQIMVPFREFDLLDITADFLGSLLGPYWMSRRRRKERRLPFSP